MSEAGYESQHIEDVLEENGEISVCTSGVSMYPMLRNRRDMIVLKKLDRDLRKNDVPLYRAPSGKLVLHRILEVTPDGYIIRGDNLFCKEKVKHEQIIGVLKAFYRGGKYFDCEKSRKYKIYIVLNRVSYPIRYFWRFKLRPVLSKIKHTIFK